MDYRRVLTCSYPDGQGYAGSGRETVSLPQSELESVTGSVCLVCACEIRSVWCG